MPKKQFGDLPLGANFKHGRSIYLKCLAPFIGTSMGGVRRTGKGYNWKSFEDKQLVEEITNNV